MTKAVINWIVLSLAILASVANASPIPPECSTLANFSSVTPNGERDLFFNVATTFTGLVAAPPQTSTFACKQVDKIFSDFTLQAGELPADLGIELDLGNLPSGDVHTLNLMSS